MTPHDPPFLPDSAASKAARIFRTLSRNQIQRPSRQLSHRRICPCGICAYLVTNAMWFPARRCAFYSKLLSRGGSIHARDSRGSALFAPIITDWFRGRVVISIMWWTKRLTCFSSEPISWFSLAKHGWTRYSPAGSIVQDNGKSVFAVGVWSGATMTSGRLLSFQRTEGWIRGNFNGMAETTVT